jgi:hypothetical protein
LPELETVATGHGVVLYLAERPVAAAHLVPWATRFPVELCRQPALPSSDRALWVERLDAALEPATLIPID